MPLNNVNVGKEFLLIQKCGFRQQAFLTFDNLPTILNKVRFPMDTLSLIEINMCCTAFP